MLFRPVSEFRPHLCTEETLLRGARQLYHFVAPGSRRIAATSSSASVTVSAFLDGATNALAVVGVREGGSNRVQIMLPEATDAMKDRDLYETTPTLDCRKVATIPTKNGVAEFEIPDEAIFTLVSNRD